MWMSRLLRKEMLKTSDLSKDIKTEEGLQKEFKLFRIHLFCCITLFCMINVATITNSVYQVSLFIAWFLWLRGLVFSMVSKLSFPPGVTFWLTGEPIGRTPVSIIYLLYNFFPKIFCLISQIKFVSFDFEF